MKNLFLLCPLLYSSVFFGQNIWEPINFPDTLYPQTINAESIDYIYVTAKVSGDVYLLRSYDDGTSWETLSLKTDYVNRFFTIHYNSNDVLFLGTRQNIFRSFDKGDHFDTVYGNYDVQDVIIKIRSFDNNEIYALGRSKIIRSTDNGSSWDTIYFSNFQSQYFTDIEISQNGNIYAVCVDFDSVSTGFLRSLDHGETWEHIGITNTHLETINLNSAGQIIVSGEDLDGIYSSSDYGETWTHISELKANSMESFNNMLVAGSDLTDSPGCWLSYDWGINWVDLIDSVVNPLVHQISISPSKHIYIQCDFWTNKNQLFKSINPILFTSEKRLSSVVEIFPNPTRNKITISTKTDKNILNYDIYNINGQKVQSGKNTYNEIDVSKLNAGLYIIEFEFENKIVSKKIIIE